MSKVVNISFGVDATLVTYNSLRPSRTLLINAHGMQAQAYFEPIGGLPPPIPPRNYAFTVPWDRALFNPFFKQNEPNLYRYATRFLANPALFSSRAPALAIYPFLFEDVAWRPLFEAFILRDLCDIAHFSNLTIGTDSITLDQLLRAPHWGAGGSIADAYDSFLLLTCRSNLARGVGMGGAQPAHPNGLYKADAHANPTVAIA